MSLLCGGHTLLTLVLFPGWLFAKYPNIAQMLRRGDLTPARAADGSPAYLLLNVVLSPTLLRWLQAIIGGLTILLTFRLAPRERNELSRWCAAVALTLTQPWLLYSAVLEPEILIAALNLGAIGCLAVTRRPRTSALAGLLLGFSFAFRPAVAPFALVALVWLLFGRYRRREPAVGHVAAYAVCFLVAAALPVTILYAAARQDWRTTMSAGMVFHQGHRPEDLGVRAHYPGLMKLVEAQSATAPEHEPDYAHQLYRTFAAGAAGGALPGAAVERYWIDRALAFAHSEPAAFARHLLRKWVFAVAAIEPGADVAGALQATQDQRFPGIPLRWVVLAGLAGLLLSIRSGPTARLLALYVVTYQLVYLVFYYMTRYGVTLVPAWCCLLGSAVSALWEARRAYRRLLVRALVAAAPLAVLLFDFVRFEGRLEQRRSLVPMVSTVPSLRSRGKQAEAMDRFLDEQSSFPDIIWPWSARGNGLQAGAPETALLAAERARARFGTDDPVDAFLLGTLYARGSRCDLALPLFDRAAAAGFHGTVEDTDFMLDPDLAAADCLVDRGQHDAALERVHRSLARTPGTLDGLSRAVAAHPGDAGDLERELFALHDPASAHFALARARRRWGDPSGAIADADALAKLLPETEPMADFERALALADLGRTDEALRAYASSMRIKYFVYGSERFDPMIRAMVAAHPGTRDIAVFALRHWFRQGREDEIRALVNRDPDLTSSFGR